MSSAPCVSFMISANTGAVPSGFANTFASLELRNRRRGYVRLRERSYPGSVAHSAGIDRHIVQPTGVCRAPRNTADRHISDCPRTSRSRKSSHCPQTCVAASVSASRKGSGRWGQDHEQCDSDFYGGVRHGKRLCNSREQRCRETDVGSQFAETIKLNFINWILRSVSVWRPSGKALTNKPARGYFRTIRAASWKNLRGDSVANRQRK